MLKERISAYFRNKAHQDDSIIERFPDWALPRLMTVRNDGGTQNTTARFLESLSAYKTINHEVTGKSRPDEDAYVEEFHKSIKEDYIWQLLWSLPSFLCSDPLVLSSDALSLD